MKQELTQIMLDLKEHLLLLLLVDNQNKLWSSLQTPHRTGAQHRHNICGTGRGFHSSFTRLRAQSGSSSSIGFFSQSHHFWSWFEDCLQGPGLNHQLVSHREQRRVMASRAHQSCKALFSSVYMKRMLFFFFFPKNCLAIAQRRGGK